MSRLLNVKVSFIVGLYVTIEIIWVDDYDTILKINGVINEKNFYPNYILFFINSICEYNLSSSELLHILGCLEIIYDGNL